MRCGGWLGEREKWLEQLECFSRPPPLEGLEGASELFFPDSLVSENEDEEKNHPTSLAHRSEKKRWGRSSFPTFDGSKLGSRKRTSDR